jgi:hypothetical protein
LARDKEKDAHEACQRALLFLEPGEQIQAAFKATRKYKLSEYHYLEAVIDEEMGFQPNQPEEMDVIGVTDHAIFVVKPSNEPKTGPYRRYPRNMYFQLNKAKSPLRFGEKWFRLGDDKFFIEPRKRAYWEPSPPDGSAKLGPVEMAIEHANAALDIMIANHDIDAAPSSAPAQQGATDHDATPASGDPTRRDRSPQARQGATSPPPGWYPDPEGAPGMRYWDGRQWNPTAQPPARQGATSPPPGWYPDPKGAPGMRYWDGRQWNPTAQPPAR